MNIVRIIFYRILIVHLLGKTFSKLTLQDKILIIGKLINRARSGDGYKTRSMERALVALNRELNRQIMETWRQAYSK
jgi:hypothetical protein